MINTLATAAYYLLGWVLLTTTLSWLTAIAYPYARRAITNSHANEAALYTWLFALSAPITALATLIILALPELAHPLIAPHCHDSVCEPHAMQFMMESLLSTITLAMGLAASLLVGFLMISQVIANQQRLYMLERLSESDTAGYLKFENANRIAWCFGLFTPKVFLSTGLLKSATDEQRQIILAHELAHASRYDNLRQWLLKWATLAWSANRKIQIQQDFTQQCTSICDIQAFNALKTSMEPIKFINTLKHFYRSQQTQEAHWIYRLQALETALDKYQGQYYTFRFQTFMFSLLIIAAWLLVVAGAVYAGHPLLEMLAL